MSVAKLITQAYERAAARIDRRYDAVEEWQNFENYSHGVLDAAEALGLEVESIRSEVRRCTGLLEICTCETS